MCVHVYEIVRNYDKFIHGDPKKEDTIKDHHKIV